MFIRVSELMLILNTAPGHLRHAGSY